MKNFFNWQDQTAERVVKWILQRPVWFQFAMFFLGIGCFAGAAFILVFAFLPQWAWLVAAVVAGGMLLSFVVKVVIRLFHD